MGKFDFIGQEGPDASGPAEDAAGREAPQGGTRIRLRDWIATILIALLAALFIRGFIIEAFRIPSSSMERSLLVGDFVLVSKLNYGPRTPISLGIPFTNIYFDGLALPSVRLPGVSRPRHGDVIVFNYPVEDSPVDRKTHYIKRLVGLPGDTLVIEEKVPYVNGMPVPYQAEMKQRWTAYNKPREIFPVGRLWSSGAEEVTSLGARFAGVTFEATVALAREVATWEEVEAVEPFVVPGVTSGMRVFPRGSGFGKDNYGPLYIPARGDTLTLTEQNWMAYAALIRRYEGHDARPLGNGRFLVDGVQTNRYVVQQDYFFVMGDNRDRSSDSRVWGFVPWDHVVGKAFLVYFSWDHDADRPRFDRVFHTIE